METNIRCNMKFKIITGKALDYEIDKFKEGKIIDKLELFFFRQEICITICLWKVFKDTQEISLWSTTIKGLLWTNLIIPFYSHPPILKEAYQNWY